MIAVTTCAAKVDFSPVSSLATALTTLRLGGGIGLWNWFVVFDSECCENRFCPAPIGQSSRPYLTSECFRFVHADVRLGDQRSQIVCDCPDRLPGVAPMNWKPDLMPYLPVHQQRLKSMCHHCARFDFTARSGYHKPRCMLDAALGCQFRPQLYKHFGLQFVQPAIETAHRTAEIMLSEPVSCRDHRIPRIARRGELIE